MPSLTDLFIYGKSETYKCTICNQNCNLKHLLYDCMLSQDIWNFVYNMYGYRITYRKLILGYQSVDKYTKFVNYFISIVAYTIYKSYLRELKDKIPRTFDAIIQLLKYEISLKKMYFIKIIGKRQHFRNCKYNR